MAENMEDKVCDCEQDLKEENEKCNDCSCEDEVNNTSEKSKNIASESDIKETEEKLKQKEKECEEYIDLLRRTKAEFDNFRKRSTKEKEGMYDNGYGDAINDILPILDNLERAVEYNNNPEDSFAQGVDMVLKMFKETLQKSGVNEIKALGEKFDPNYHNAVMHIEDEEKEENVVVEVLQKGYSYKDKVIRYSMVKVAN